LDSFLRLERQWIESRHSVLGKPQHWKFDLTGRIGVHHEKGQVCVRPQELVFDSIGAAIGRQLERWITQ